MMLSEGARNPTRLIHNPGPKGFRQLENSIVRLGLKAWTTLNIAKQFDNLLACA